jgi:benzoylformate decarboxylase
MPTVRDVTYEILRTRGLTTIFGNPGSNELVFLDGMLPDFTYVLGLLEDAVLSMADGYSLASGQPVFVNRRCCVERSGGRLDLFRWSDQMVTVSSVKAAITRSVGGSSIPSS